MDLNNRTRYSGLGPESIFKQHGWMPDQVRHDKVGKWNSNNAQQLSLRYFLNMSSLCLSAFTAKANE